MRLSIGTQEFVKKGLSAFDPHDPYHFAVSLSWKRFAFFFIAAEIVINAAFAGLYTLQPGAIANQPMPGFFSAFFFSLETLATVGYGEMYPGTTYGHIVSSLEIVTGTVFTAIMTGLLFIRFSKPRARVLYAAHPVVTMNNGKPTLMLRIGNARTNVLHNVTLSLHTLVRSTSTEGQRQANIVELPLQRSRFPIFAILYTMMHVIDETSPLYGLDPAGEDFQALRLFVTISAKDPSVGQEVSDLHTIAGTDIRVGMRYVDAITPIDTNKVLADYSLLSAIEPETGTVVVPSEV
jgi:inward rectifier potassium channel